MKNYNILKEKALEKEPVFRNMDINNVYIHNVNTVDINGKTYSTEFEFITRLTEEIGLSSISVSQLQKNLGDKEVNLILNKSFSNFFKRHSRISGNIIGDRETAKLFRFSKGEIITYKTVFEALDKVYEKYKDIELVLHRGDFSMLMVEDRKIKIKDLPEETYTPNVGLKYVYGEAFGLTKVMNRLTCTNQIRMEVYSRSNNKLSGINSSVSILNSLKRLDDNRFNMEYASKIEKIKDMYASLKEYESVMRMIKKFTGRKGHFLDSLFQKYDIDMFVAARKDRLMDVDKRTISTPVKYWDLINGITDFASHDYVYLKYNEREFLQTKAFEFLNRTPDMLIVGNN